MLDTQTKKRIDDCRDILVGKLPDPKAQIEQITIGLIYKFMDDMDKEVIELGGKARFFSDYKVADPEFPADRNKDKLVEFSKFSWDNLLKPNVTATEMLNLYSEAIMNIDKNPNIPQLFREIFKNAYLPYRDPETLKLFLKTIDEFSYTHSEKLGDAFEYLLSVMGSQGDAGQFRTPRHIIDFLVSINDPAKHDSILDPACGTAGFLISAYKHILLKNTKENEQNLSIYEYNKLDKKPFNNLGNMLKPDEKKKLIENFAGYDISPDMVRLSLVNLYLHGFPNPDINEYDTLSSEERWNERFDLVLANPPFMSPKGGIRPHKKFSIKSNRSEVLFVDYIAEHLNLKGKAGVIVPEGVIFQGGTAYKALRKMLVETCLYAVVSLPAGVFNPYSGVKTSILLMDKEVAKRTKDILFVKIDNDGYNLGAQRTAVKGSQLEEAIAIIQQYRTTTNFPETTIAHLVSKSELAKNGEYNLSGERYRSQQILAQLKFPMIKIGEIMEFQYGKPLKKEDRNDGPYPVYGSNGIVGYHDEFIAKPPFIVVGRKGSAGALHFSEIPGYPIDTTFYIEDKKTEKLNIKYAFYILDTLNLSKVNVQAGIPGLNRNDAYSLKIPLPPLSVQEEIVAEIEQYQKIIDGAKAVVANYKPKIQINPDWPMVEFKDAPFEIIDGDRGSNYPKSEDFSENGYCIFLNTKNVRPDGFNFEELMFITKERDEMLRKGRLNRHDVLLTTRGTVGNTAYYSDNVVYDHLRINSGMLIFRPDQIKLLPEYLFYFFQSENCQSQFKRIISGAAQPQLPIRSLNNAYIPLPDLELQKEIVMQIKKEQELVNANKQLIEIFEKKIKDRIAKVWGK